MTEFVYKFSAIIFYWKRNFKYIKESKNHDKLFNYIIFEIPLKCRVKIICYYTFSFLPRPKIPSFIDKTWKKMCLTAPRFPQPPVSDGTATICPGTAPASAVTWHTCFGWDSCACRCCCPANISCTTATKSTVCCWSSTVTCARDRSRKTSTTWTVTSRTWPTRNKWSTAPTRITIVCTWSEWNKKKKLR